MCEVYQAVEPGAAPVLYPLLLSAALGAVLVLGADLLARSAFPWQVPVGIVTKSPLVTRDTDVLTKMQATVFFSIPFPTTEKSKPFELYTPIPDVRFRAMKTLSEAGIKVGIGIAPVALRYGARSYSLYRYRDDRYKFQQMAEFEDKAEFEAYWYGPEFVDFRVIASSWYQVPVVYGWTDLVAAGTLEPEMSHATHGGPAGADCYSALLFRSVR